MRAVSTIQRWWPPLVWAGLILGMSSVPGSQLDDVGLPVPDKLVHAIEYAVFGALVVRAREGGGAASRRAALVAVLAGTLLGALDENYQRLVPQRDPSWADWVADVGGSGLGALLAISRAGRALRGTRRSG